MKTIKELETGCGKSQITCSGKSNWCKPYYLCPKCKAQIQRLKDVLELIDEGCGLITPREKGIITHLKVNNCAKGRLCWRCIELKARIKG